MREQRSQIRIGLRRIHLGHCKRSLISVIGLRQRRRMKLSLHTSFDAEQTQEPISEELVL